MATSVTLDALKKTKEAIDGIKKSLEPVVERLKADAFEKTTAQAQATVALSVGMMKYMGARLQGLDQGRTVDDPLRRELNQMRKVLAQIKAKSIDREKGTTNGKATKGPTPASKESAGSKLSKPQSSGKGDQSAKASSNTSKRKQNPSQVPSKKRKST